MMARVEGIEAEARTFPADSPESDGTLEWDATTIVLVRVRADGESGTGYTYADGAVAALIEGLLADAIDGRDALATADCWQAMHAALRNAGQADAGAMALSAVDLALHDLHGRLLGAPLHRLLGAARDGVPIYASGGFCWWALERLRAWCADGAVAERGKIKIGCEPERRDAGGRAARPRRVRRTTCAPGRVARSGPWRLSFVCLAFPSLDRSGVAESRTRANNAIVRPWRSCGVTRARLRSSPLTMAN